MTFLEFLESNGGLAFLHFLQAVLFLMMIYILTAEYIRTRNADLIFKLTACSSITIINVATIVAYSLLIFYDIEAPQSFFPLLLNSMFVIVVLALAHAFIYEFITRKDVFQTFFWTNVIGIIIAYPPIQISWLSVFKEGMLFENSSFQLSFSIYFILVLTYIIYLNAKHRKKYRLRLSIAFLSIIVVQLCNIYGVYADGLTGAARVIRSAAPLLVPIMFGSVVFKELIENNVRMTSQLKDTFSTQQKLVNELDHMSHQLGSLSEKLFEKSYDSWSRLTDIKELVDVEKNHDLDQHIRMHSRDIEEVAGLTENLRSLIETVNDKTEHLSRSSAQISYINQHT
ncbi:MAG: hypothetical protein NXI24_01085 [bacterium]|nr:hypothetical protein [bacterium]